MFKNKPDTQNTTRILKFQTFPNTEGKVVVNFKPIISETSNLGLAVVLHTLSSPMCFPRPHIPFKTLGQK